MEELRTPEVSKTAFDERSEEVCEIAQALSKAQAQMKPVIKRGKNPSFKSEYATLDDIIDSLREPFSTNGLTFTQLVTVSGDTTLLKTVLMHSSGQYMTSVLPVKSVAGNRATNELQVFGIALTYTKRYALAAIAGVSLDDDTDGNAPQQARQEQDNQQQRQQSAPQSQDASGNTVEITHVGIHNTRNGKHRIGFWAEGEQYPRIHVFVREDLASVAPFVGLVYGPEKFAPDVADGTKYPFVFSMTHDGEKYPSPVSAEFTREHREAMAAMLVKTAHSRNVQIELDDELSDEWFTDAVAKIKAGQNVEF